VDIPALIRHSFELIAHQCQLDGITLVEDYAKPLPLAFCNPQQVQQVLLNVFSNARYALNQRYPGAHADKRIEIAVTGRGRDKSRSLRITITDYGTGIEHHIMDRLMDPFFSTKAKGEGTGLGLSISHNLIQENKGNFRIKSQLGKYTTILIDLPAAAGGDASHA
jgi:signal transduction histidine kinase